jgi:uncharacterized repeat protein (TIGR01451 family)
MSAASERPGIEEDPVMRSSRRLGVLAGSALLLAACGAAHGQLVISQIYGGGGSTTGTPAWAHDWVEIYNRGSADVPLANHAIQYASSTGTTWTVQAIGGGPVTSLAPGQYLLVRLGRGTATSLGAVLTTQDVTGPELGSGTIAMSATAGKVALTSSVTALTGANPTGGAILDLVGYGSSATGSETTPASVTGLTTGTSLARRLDGCYDTNNNLNDFAIGTASPRSSTSPVNTPCPAATDLSIATPALASCDAGVAGSSVTYTFNVTNSGLTAASGVATLTFPAHFTFVSSSPAGTLGVGTISIPTGTISPATTAPITLTLAANAIGTGPAGSIAIDGPTLDVNSANNGPVTGSSVFVSPATPVAATAVIVTADPAGPLGPLATDVPGLAPGTKFLWTPAAASGEFISRMFPSDNGTRWIARARTNQGSAADDVLLIYNSLTDSFSVGAQQGQEWITGSGVFLGEFDQTVAINDSGDFTFSTTPTGASTAQTVLKRVGGVDSVVATAGDSNALLTIAPSLLSATNSAAGISATGAVSFHTTTGATATSTGVTQDAVFSGDGSILLAREGTVALGTGTVPADQAGGTTWQWTVINSGSSLDTAPYFSNSGNSLINGTIDAPTGTDPDALVYNGNVVVQGAVTPIGAGTVGATGLLSATLKNSNWLATGTTATGSLDWALLNGTLVALEGTPAIIGGTENLQSNFGAGAVNSIGDWAITSFLNTATDYNDVVVIVNGTHIVLRENDPIDLDGNGTVDGYVRTLRNSRLTITEDRKLFIALEIGGAPQPCGTAQRTKVAEALLRINLPPTTKGTCCIAGACTFVNDASACVGGVFTANQTCLPVNPCPVVSTVVCCRGSTCEVILPVDCTPVASPVVGAVVSPAASCGVQNSATLGCCFADFNKAGGVTIDDIFIYLNAWFASSEYSNVGAPGTPNIDDIFIFLNAWFAGCGTLP